jgi:Immunoglobulin domain
MKSIHHLQQSRVELGQNPTRRNRLTSLLITLMASLAILALSSTTARAQTLTNWVTNPGFEASTTTWTGWARIAPWTWNATSAIQTTNSIINGGTTNAIVHGGGNAIKIWGCQGANYTTYPGVMQTFACAPGSTWTADGWAATLYPDSLRANSYGSETAFFEVLFMDSGVRDYTNALLYCYSAPLTTNSPINTYLHLVVTNSTGGTTLTAPAGTTRVRVQAVFAQQGGFPPGSAYYDDIQLIRTSKPDPEITVQPAPLTKVYGQTAVFSVVADGLSTLTYKWQKDAADITDPNAHGVTTPTLTLSNVTTAMQGNYTVTVTDSAGPLTSDQVYLTVYDPGVISITPALGQTVVAGTNITIEVAAAGSSALTYAWYKDGNPLANNGHYSGVTTPTLGISSVTTADTSTNYSVQVNSGPTASSGLKVVTAAQLATNLLSNAGFEDSVWSLPWENAWTKFNGAQIATTNQTYYLTATPVSVYDGTYVGQVYNNGNVDDGIYQNVPVVAGTTYHAGAHCYVSSLEPMTGTAWTVLQLFFKDAGGNNIASFISGHIDISNALFPMDIWTNLQLTNGPSMDLVAPAGAVSATVQVYENASTGGGSVYLDDIYLTPVTVTPPPPSPFSVTPTVSGGQFNLSFPTTSGTIYEVLYTGNAASLLSTWQTNTTIIGDGSVRTVPDTISAGARFYRVRAHNP